MKAFVFFVVFFFLLGIVDAFCPECFSNSNPCDCPSNGCSRCKEENRCICSISGHTSELSPKGEAGYKKQQQNYHNIEIAKRLSLRGQPQQLSSPSTTFIKGIPSGDNGSRYADNSHHNLRGNFPANDESNFCYQCCFNPCACPSNGCYCQEKQCICSITGDTTSSAGKFGSRQSQRNYHSNQQRTSSRMTSPTVAAVASQSNDSEPVGRSFAQELRALSEIGLNDQEANIYALKAYDGDVARAANFLLTTDSSPGSMNNNNNQPSTSSTRRSSAEENLIDFESPVSTYDHNDQPGPSSVIASPTDDDRNDRQTSVAAVASQRRRFQAAFVQLKKRCSINNGSDKTLALEALVRYNGDVELAANYLLEKGLAARSRGSTKRSAAKLKNKKKE